MKPLKNIIYEKLTLNKNLKINNKIIPPEEIKGPETPGKDYFDDDVIIIGKPFKSKTSKEYLDTKIYIKQNHYSIWSDLEDIEDKEMFDWFCYVNNGNNNEVNCYVYGTEGVYAIKE